VIAFWLITISFIFENYWSSDSSLKAVHKKISNYLHEQESDFNQLINDSIGLKNIIDNKNSTKEVINLAEKRYFIFLYHSGNDSSENLIYWNNQKILPAQFMLYGGEKGFCKLNNGYYVWLKIEKKEIKAIALIPIQWNYYIENEYLKNDFAFDQTISNRYGVEDSIKHQNLPHLTVLSVDGFKLIDVIKKNCYQIQSQSFLVIILQIISILFLFLYLQNTTNLIISNKNSFWGIAFLISSIVAFRILIYLFPLAFNNKLVDVFNLFIYQNNGLKISLGGYFLDLILLNWIILTINKELSNNQHKIIFNQSKLKWAVLFLTAFFMLLITYLFSNIIRTIAFSQYISFDVLNFFTLNLSSLFAFICLALSTIAFFYLSKACLFIVQLNYKKSFMPLFLLTAILGLLLLSLNLSLIKNGFEIFVLIWLLIFEYLYLLIYKRINYNQKITSKLLFWIAFFSISISLILFKENNIKEIQARKQYAKTLLVKSDPANETMINSMLIGFRSDFLTKNYQRLYAASLNFTLKDSIINSNPSGYTNKYDTRIYSYNYNEMPLYNDDSTSFQTFNTILTTSSKPTSIPGLFYFDQSFNLFSYIHKKTIYDTTGNTVGFLFILATPKKQRVDAIYPELFSKGSNNAIENSPQYSIAAYNNWKILNSNNDYSFKFQLDAKNINKQEYSIIDNKNYNELWYNAGLGKVVIIVKQNNFWLEIITLFSYLFCFFLIIGAIISFFILLNNSQLIRANFIKYLKLSIRNQIYGTIILISTLSFLIIGTATILFFIKRYESNNREKLSKTIRIMEKEVVSDFFKNSTDSLITEKVKKENLELAISKISSIHGVDVNIYDLNGDLKISSLALPYNKGILSNKINPIAYYHLAALNEIQFFQKENIGKLNYISNYIPVIDERGNKYAYLNIPYFTSQNILKQEISNFLVTVINLNVFIFLIAGIISILITNRITDSFAVITEKMKRINLESQNEFIKWDRNDEIGALVLEYNKMIAKLEESANMLAQTERESAWKEMARQVAHEIKNPLTPMKLSMQFLQKSIENNNPNIIELTKNVSKTLIEQIDHLSTIANAFSQFANIGEAKKEKLNLNEMVEHVIKLNELNEDIEIRNELIAEDIYIEADKTQINRLFTNIIINAIQSVPESRQAKITISQRLQNEKILTKIMDNGSGINEEVQSKIFTPNFTTKTSGTGLGLAMCKRIVEQTNGEIWFETLIGEGTSFYIEFPLIKQS